MWSCKSETCDGCEWYKETPIVIGGKTVAVEIKCTNPEVCTKYKKT